MLQSSVTEGQSLKLLLQDPARGDEQPASAELQRAFDARASGLSSAPQLPGSEAPSLYKFKINMGDLLE